MHAREHAFAIARLRASGREVSVSAAIDADASRARSFAGELDIPLWSSDVSGSLAAPNVDAVIVCAPTDAHRELTLAAAEAEKPTLVEKPLAATLEEVDTIIEAFEARSVLLFAGHNTRFDPVSEEMRSVAGDGSLGRVSAVVLHQDQGYAWADGWRAWQLDARRSGGRLLHLGIHNIDLACWLIQAGPTVVRAQGLPDPGGAPGAWHSADAQLRFPGGEVALLTWNWQVVPAHVFRRCVVVVGSEGDAWYDSARDELLAVEGPYPDRSVTYERSIAAELAHWLDCVEGFADPLVTPRQARISIEVSLAAERSAAGGGLPVALGEQSFGA
jgi:predicted dehydrogenase